MKFNKWTVGLAAVGAVSLGSVAQAEEHAVATALANTTFSGYVDTSLEWNLGGDKNHFPPYAFNGGHKADGFNLNVIKLTFEKPQDEGEWAAGYKVDLLFGPDAVGYNTSANSGATADFAIKQAYVALRVPVAGNGIDLKVGVFDTIIGYEVFDSGSNPNFTRSYAYTAEPTEHTGVLASYKVNDYVSLSAGVANTLSAGIDARRGPGGVTQLDSSRKTWMGSVALTAPKDWGFLEGSTLYAGAIAGFAGGTGKQGNDNQVNYYVGAVVKTPVTGLTAGAAFDYVDNLVAAGGESVKIAGLYSSYQLPDSKLSVHVRGEYFDGGFVNRVLPAAVVPPFGGPWTESVAGYDLTATLQYDLWKNVISRLEVRWDHTLNDVAGFGDGLHSNPGPFRSKNAYTVLANFIYKF